MDQWHHLHICAQGRQVRVTLNGQKILAANLDDYKDSFARIPGPTKTTGRIGLQLGDATQRAGSVEFKNIRVKELPPTEPGWVQLFNGKDLMGWETLDKKGTRPTGRLWTIAITCDGPCSYLFSKRDDYQDFHFRVEARLNAKGNSGQYFRCRFEPGWPKGYYAQINNSDPAAGTRTGSLNRVALSGKFEILLNVPGGLVLDDAWFTQEVIAKGNHTPDSGQRQEGGGLHRQGQHVHARPPRPGAKKTEPATALEFRKIEIKELPPEEPGWVQLFNGKDLTGWTTFPKGPATGKSWTAT